MELTKMVVPTGRYGERYFTDTVTTVGIYTFPVTQHYVKILNPLYNYITVNVGSFTNKIIGPYETWEGWTSFDSFDVTVPEECTITITTREYETNFTKQEDIWLYNNMQILTDGDIVLDGTDNGTSAGTINTGITADGYYDVNFVFDVENTAGTKYAWYNGRFETSVAVVSADGLAEVLTCNVTDGVGTGIVRYTGEWVAGDIVTLTVIGGTQMGYTVADIDIVDTLIA